jgi:hypothetical protein
MLEIVGSEVKLTREDYSAERLVFGHPYCVVAILPLEGEEVVFNGMGHYGVCEGVGHNVVG